MNLLRKELKAQIDIEKHQYNFLKDKKNNVIYKNGEDGDIREKEKSGESNITKTFGAVLKDIDF